MSDLYKLIKGDISNRNMPMRLFYALTAAEGVGLSCMLACTGVSLAGMLHYQKKHSWGPTLALASLFL